MKEELGWDELQAMKYRAWDHHLALIALALWFSCKIKIKFSLCYPGDTILSEQLQVNVLPQISLPNIRNILQALFPVLRPSLFETQMIIVKTFVDRSRYTATRLRCQTFC